MTRPSAIAAALVLMLQVYPAWTQPIEDPLNELFEAPTPQQEAEGADDLFSGAAVPGETVFRAETLFVPEAEYQAPSSIAEQLDALPFFEVEKQSVELSDREPAIHGVLFTPKETTPDLAILTLHDWWGLDEDALAESQRLAHAGKVVLALDLYQGRTPEDRGEAAVWMREAAGESGQAMIAAGREWLSESATERTLPVAVVGWNNGARLAMQSARSTTAPLAVALYGGGLVFTEPAAEEIGCPVITFCPLDDGYFTEEKIERFDTVLELAGVDHEIHEYPVDGNFAMKVAEGDNRSFADSARTLLVRFFEDALSAESDDAEESPQAAEAREAETPTAGESP